MERLSFGPDATYSATEAAIHLARYQLVVPYCRGKRVLDLACGEGYGSHILAAAGAAHVDAVDRSDIAINAARQHFADSSIQYHQHDAERIDELFEAETFDVVVSIETIEHLNDPAKFLRAVAAVAKKDATIIITCPNDLWYYPKSHQGNQHHIRKYSFQDFRRMATAALGGEVQWGYGAPVIGYGNFAIDWPARFDAADYNSVVRGARELATEIVVPAERTCLPDPSHSSYFIGIWRAAKDVSMTGSAVYPVSMEALERQAFLVSWNADKTHPDLAKFRIAELEAEVTSLKARIVETEDQLYNEKANVAEMALEFAGTKVDINQSTADYASLATDLSDFAQYKSAQINALKDELHDTVQKAEGYRLQAFALSKELEIVSSRVAELSAEQNRLLAIPRVDVAQVMAHNQALQEQVSALLNEPVKPIPSAQSSVPTVPAPGIGGLIKHASRIRVLRAGRAVKPYLPKQAHELALRIAHKLKL